MLKAVISQFRQPRGWLGRLVGWIMATRPSNLARNRWTVELLALAPRHRVLEIGYGPGVAVFMVAAKLTDGRIEGWDHSATMWNVARRRNSLAVAQGRVSLSHGGLEALDTLSGPYDRVYSVNVAQFWPERVTVYKNIRRLLSPGGYVVSTFQPRGRAVSDADALSFGEKLIADMRAAGFVNVELRQGPRVGALTIAAIGYA